MTQENSSKSTNRKSDYKSDLNPTFHDGDDFIFHMHQFHFSFWIILARGVIYVKVLYYTLYKDLLRYFEPVSVIAIGIP